MTSLGRRSPLILLSGIALAVGLYVRSKIPELTVGDPRMRWETPSFLWYLVFCLLTILLVWWGYSALMGLILRLNRREVMKGDLLL